MTLVTKEELISSYPVKKLTTKQKLASTGATLLNCALGAASIYNLFFWDKVDRDYFFIVMGNKFYLLVIGFVALLFSSLYLTFRLEKLWAGQHQNRVNDWKKNIFEKIYLSKFKDERFKVVGMGVDTDTLQVIIDFNGALEVVPLSKDSLCYVSKDMESSKFVTGKRVGGLTELGIPDGLYGPKLHLPK